MIPQDIVVLKRKFEHQVKEAYKLGIVSFETYTPDRNKTAQEILDEMEEENGNKRTN